MSEIIETYQQEQEQLAKPELPGMAFATVVSVHNDGLELQFDGEDEASTKHFPCNVGVSFAAGQRVLMQKINGSYVAMCPVGLRGSGGGGSFEVVKHRTTMSVSPNEKHNFSLSISNPGKTPLGIIGLQIDANNAVPVVYRAYISASSPGSGTITATYYNVTANSGIGIYFDFYVLWQ